MTKRPAIAILLLLGMALAGLAEAQTTREVWRWVDANGVVHFSDTPQQGATRVQLAGSPATSAPKPAAPLDTSAARPAAPERLQYESLKLTQPGNGETFFNADAQVPVGLSLTPSLARGDELALYLDGARVEEFPPTALDFMLTGLPRGAHTLTAAVVDRDGNLLLRSEPRVFHIRQNSVANPPVGPNLRPPPRPTPRN
jgi:hypothetical protein